MLEEMRAADLVRVNGRELVFAVDRVGPNGGDTIRVTNVAEEDVAFKVKTTNPQAYIVRPNVGCIPRGKSVEILVVLTESAHKPSLGASKDRFQLRVALAPGLADEFTPADFWREISDKDPAVGAIKFHVRFVPYVVYALPSQTKKELPKPLPDVHELLKEGKREEAIKRVCELQGKLDEKNLELARLKTELAETQAETERVLRHAPAPPIAANKFVSDPFGGMNLATLAIVLTLFVVIIKFLS